MWLTKFTNWHKDCLIRPKCVRYAVIDSVYLINSWIERNKFYYTEFHILQGVSGNIKKFVKALKHEKSIIQLEQTCNNLITLNEEQLEKQYYSPVFDPRLIYVRPVVQRTDGYEDWEVASWNRELLMNLLDVPSFEIKLKAIKRVKLANLFLPKIYPKLSPKQKEAIESAVKEGYYEYPRKIYLEQLAKISKVKRQTYEENLRRAERKIVPFLTENTE